MKEEKKVKSIAKRINAYWMRRTVLLLALVDVVLYVMEANQWLTVRTEYFLPILFGSEAMLLVLQYRVGKDRARRLLEPLERITQTAQELSQARFDPEKLHHLEDAIAGVSPLAPDMQLKTGDKELRGIEQAINDLIGRMQESYREQTRFVSDASHELRTPIAVIQGYADMLQRWGKDDETVLTEGIEAIQTESAHMKKLIEQLLFLARGDNGRNQLTLEAVDLSDMMREVYEEYRMIHPERDWRLQVDASIPVQGDIAMLKQTARVLADNAVRYTEEGDVISLRARLKDGVPCFEVQDNGIGIKQEDLGRIFDRFFRSDPARARSTGGTGLGLSIAKWIVERHGGYFDVFSREGIGTRIGVVLPQQEAKSEEAQSA
ncbi:MAG: sensor histidine kinase [Clostridia bacterium]|nr:sensor histidine kinase [Clostridia bacterium]